MYQKKDPREVSAARSRAAKMRKHNNGGRKKGVPNKNTDPKLRAEPTKSVTIYQSDYDVFRVLAFKAKSTLAGFFHKVAVHMKEKNASAFEN